MNFRHFRFCPELTLSNTSGSDHTSKNEGNTGSPWFSWILFTVILAISKNILGLL